MNCSVLWDPTDALAGGLQWFGPGPCHCGELLIAGVLCFLHCLVAAESLNLCGLRSLSAAGWQYLPEGELRRLSS